MHVDVGSSFNVFPLHSALHDIFHFFFPVCICDNVTLAECDCMNLLPIMIATNVYLEELEVWQVAAESGAEVYSASVIRSPFFS